MIQVKNNLKICSLLNLFIALFLFFLINKILLIPIIFLGSSSYYYYVCSKMNDDELAKNKRILLVLGIVSIIFNFLSAVILLASLNRIEDKNIIVDNMKDNKIENKNYLLYVGPMLIILSALITLEFNSGISNLFKILFLFIISLTFMFLFKHQKNNTFLLFSFIFIGLIYFYIGDYSMLGTYFSLNGEGKYLFKATFYLISSFMTYILLKKSKKNIYLNILLLFILLSSFSLFRFINFNIADIILIHNILFLFFNLIKEENNIKIEKSTTIISTICIFITIINIYYMDLFYNNVLLIINLIINFTNIIYTLFNDKKNMFLYLTLIYILILSVINLILDDTIKVMVILLSLLIINIFSFILEKTFNIKSIIKLNNFIINLFALYILLNISTYNPYIFLVMTLLIFINSILNIKNNLVQNNLESKIFPLKILLVFISIINIMDIYLNINYNLALTLLSIIFILLNYFIKNNLMKNNSYKLSILSLIIGSTIFDTNIITFIFNIISYILILRITKDKLQKVIYSIFNFIIYINVINIFNINIVNSLIVIFIYLLLLIIYRKDKINYLVTSVFMILPFINIKNNIEFIEIGVICLSFYLYYLIYLACTKYLKNNKNLFSLIFLIIIYIFLLQYQSFIITIFEVLTAIILIVLGNYDKEYRNLFILGIIFILLTFIKQIMNMLFIIPFSVYILIVGLFITFYVIYQESKK